MRSKIGGMRPSKPLVCSVLAMFIWAMVWPGEHGSTCYGLELSAGDTVKAEFHGQVVEAPKNDSLKPVAEAQLSGVVIGGKAAGKKKGFNPLLLVAGAVGAAGVAAYFLVSGGGNKPPGGTARQDSTAMPSDSTRR